MPSAGTWHLTELERLVLGARMSHQVHFLVLIAGLRRYDRVGAFQKKDAL